MGEAVVVTEGLVEGLWEVLSVEEGLCEGLCVSVGRILEGLGFLVSEATVVVEGLEEGLWVVLLEEERLCERLLVTVGVDSEVRERALVRDWLGEALGETLWHCEALDESLPVCDGFRPEGLGKGEREAEEEGDGQGEAVTSMVWEKEGEAVGEVEEESVAIGELLGLGVLLRDQAPREFSPVTLKRKERVGLEKLEVCHVVGSVSTW